MTELTRPRADDARGRAFRPAFHLADLADLSLLDLLDPSGADRTGGMLGGLVGSAGRWWRDRSLLVGDLGWRLAAISVTAVLDCVVQSTVTRALAQAMTVGAVTVALARSGPREPERVGPPGPASDPRSARPAPGAGTGRPGSDAAGRAVIVHDVVRAAGRVFVVMTVLEPPEPPSPTV